MAQTKYSVNIQHFYLGKAQTKVERKYHIRENLIQNDISLASYEITILKNYLK